jgi:chitinase
VFSGSQVLKTVSVPVTPDTKSESDEQLAVVAAGVDGGENHRERGTGTIVTDDSGSGIRLYTSDATVVEGDSGTRNLVVPITLTKSATSDVSLHWSTVNGSAVAGSDFTSRSATTKIAAGKRQITVTIPLLSDTASEGTESFQLVVSSVTNATVSDGTGVITIRDDD